MNEILRPAGPRNDRRATYLFWAVGIALVVALLWPMRALPLVASLAWNNYGSLRLNRALLNSGQDPLAQRADIAGAGGAFQMALAWLPQDGLAYYNLGTLYSAGGQAASAAQAFSQATAALPWDVSAHFELGQSYAAQGRADLAEPEWRQARAASFFVTQSRVRRAQGDQAGAQALLQTAVELEPDLPTAYYALGDLYADGGNTIQALALYQAGLNKDLSPVSRWVAQAQMATFQQDWLKALRYSQQALELDPGSLLLYLRVGQAYASLGRTEQAGAYYRQAIQLDRNYASAWAALVESHVQAGDCSQAENDLPPLFAVRPEGEFQADVQVRVARCYASAQQPARAVPLLQAAIERAPKAVSYRLTLAQVYVAARQYQAAIREYRAILKLEPGNAKAQAALESLNASEQ